MTGVIFMNEAYDRPDFARMADDQLVDLCFDVGLDSLPNTNQYGELNNRDEVIAALIQSHDEATSESIKNVSFKQWLAEQDKIVSEAKKFTGKPMFKPRAKDLNAALVSKKGGKHFSEKGQYKRAAEKQKMRREQDE